MENKRGRPPVVEKETFVDTILANKAKIYVDECVVVKQHAVWTDLSLIFGKRLTPRSIYSMVVNNRYQILNQLSGSLEKTQDDSVNSQTDKSIDLLNASDIEKVYNKRLITFHSDISVEDMEKLTTYVEYSKSTREAKAGKRKYRRFKTGIYQPYFSKMIRDNTELICGWNFANQYINIPATDGKIQVYCRCGSQGSIVLCRYSEDQNVRLTCQITPGTGKKCGPQYLRAEERRNEVVPRIIDEGSVDQYRAACSREMGLKIGQTKPQILRNSNVLHVAKTKETKLKYLHEDPIEALDIMKCTIHLNEIHDIGKNPFFVDFFSNEQIQICKMIRKKDGRLVLCMDATGLKMDSIKRSHSSEQRKIFLYIISTNTDVGQTTVSQRLGERHKSSDLVTFLNHYHSCGAPHPDEFVSDRGRSILNAAVRVYTNYENIDQYASNMQYPVEVRRYDSIHDYVKTLEVPYSEETRIRVDNAHFLSNYRSLFKGISIRGVYTFYMAGVDQLMLALDLKDAKEILRALFIVSNCPRTGFLPDGRPTECSKSISFLKQLTHGIDKDTAYPNTDDLDSSESEMFIHETNDTVECEDSTSNRWKKWGEDIYDNCKGHFDDQGSDDNLYWIKNIKLSDTLKRDVSLIPIWGNIFSPFYEGCRIPASTAGCEGEINKIKSYWRGKKLHSIRPDVFVHETLEFLKGKLPILASDLQEAHNQNEKNSEENSFECNICTKSLIAKEAYACNYCQNFVHKNKCTEDIEEKLFCKKCSKDKVVIRNASSKTVENWGGFGEPRSGKSEKNQQTIEKIKPVDFLSQEHNKYRLCSKYHGKRPDDVRDSEVFYKSSSFPVIRNGNDPKLEKQIINKQPTILQNTCSFDAVLYLALFAAHDYPNVNKQIKQLHFTTWPDHGVPLYSQSLVPFLQKLLKIPYSTQSPILIHCSAGVGRTGTIILSDICLRMAAGEGFIDFLAHLENLRNQRANLVDNIEQYKLAHLVVLECLFGMRTTIPCNEDMQTIIESTISNNGIRTQMKYILETKWHDSAMEAMLENEEDAPIYPEKNRFPDIIPDQYRLYITKYPYEDESSSYINAILVDGFRSPGRFIVTQQPMPNTLGDFWRMVWERSCTVIISLNSINLKDETCCQVWPEKGEELQPVDFIKIVHKKTQRLDFYRIITVEVSAAQTATNSSIVNIVAMNNWRPQDLLPNSIEELLTFIDAAYGVSRTSENVIVTCYDGAKASGLYVAMSFLIEQMKLEQECDVCLAVRTIRHSRKQFVTTEEQYEFLYRAALTFITGFQSYSNFA